MHLTCKVITLVLLLECVYRVHAVGFRANADGFRLGRTYSLKEEIAGREAEDSTFQAEKESRYLLAGQANVTLQGNITTQQGNMTQGNITQGNMTQGNITTGNITIGNITTGSITIGNITIGNITQGNITQGNITTNPSMSALSKFTDTLLSKFKPGAEAQAVVPDVPQIPHKSHAIIIEVKYDNKPYETTWALSEVLDDDTLVLIYDEPVDSIRKPGDHLHVTLGELDSGKYRFRIFDDGLDGICCENGNGWFQITDITDGIEDAKLIEYGDGYFHAFDMLEFELSD